ncbi:MAG: Hpt domain-containing protein [Planctomycetota bacterium]
MSSKLDLQRIEEKTGIGDRDLLITVAEALAQEGPLRLTEIEQGMSEQDAEKVSIAAHTLKGASRAMVMDDLAAASERIELAARKNNLDEVKEALPELTDEVSEMLEAVKQFINA